MESVYLGVDSVNTQRDRPEVGGLQLALPTSLPNQDDVGGALTVDLLSRASVQYLQFEGETATPSGQTLDSSVVHSPSTSTS